MESVPLIVARKKAEDKLRKLAAKDKKWGLHKYFNRSVLVLHEEGTTMFFRSAFSFEVETEWQNKIIKWYVVVPEHHHMLVYAADEVDMIQFKEEKILHKVNS